MVIIKLSYAHTIKRQLWVLFLVVMLWRGLDFILSQSLQILE